MDLYVILITLGVCIVLPISIVWIIARARRNEVNRKAEIMLKAIENGTSIDPELLNNKNDNPMKIKSDLMDKLTGACITSLMGIAFLVLHFIGYSRAWASYLPLAGVVLLAVGIGLFVSYFAGKKFLAKEIELEEKKLMNK